MGTQLRAHGKGAQRIGGHRGFRPVRKVTIEAKEEALGHGCAGSLHP